MQFCPVLILVDFTGKVLFEEEKGLITPHWDFSA